MSFRGNLRKMRSRGRTNRLPNPRIIAVVFALIILAGTGLLLLPVASRDGQCCGLMKALFTATSATCVTGLVLADTYVQWSGFGQAVIITLIQVGGLGFMSIVSLFAFSLRKPVGIKQRLLLAQGLSLDSVEGIVTLQKHVLKGTFLLESAGALIFFFRFLPDYGVSNALKWGIFHSISAFCNAGFDIFGVLLPGSSLSLFQTDPVVNLTVMLLVQFGGLGFFVWEDLLQALSRRSFRKLSVYTKLVLWSNTILFVLGTVLTCLLEWNNPDTLGAMTWSQKILAGAFQSTTLRTAGFAALDQGALLTPTKALSVVFMLIGGSSGSTAGGIKTVTAAVLMLSVVSAARGKERVHAFKRTIPDRQIRDAVALTLMVLMLCFFGAVFVSANSHIAFVDAIFETASALGTVGITANVTPMLSVASWILLIVFMYFGRVGLMTISLGFLTADQAEERFRYAETKLLIG